MCWRELTESSSNVLDFRLPILDYGKKRMQRKFRIRFCFSCSDNRKSEIKNRKLAGIVAIGIAFAICEVVGQAQQTGKIFRVGFLDASSASGSAVLVEAFRQELNKLGWIEGKNIAIEYR